MEKCSPPIGTIKEFLNCSPSWKDHIDLNRTVVKPQYWEVWQQVLLPTPQHKQTDATPPKTMLDDIQICVVSSDNSPDSFKEKEANTEGMAGMDCVITIEEEIEVQGKSSPESRIERRDDIKICTVPELQDKAPFVVIDGGKTKTFTKPVKDRGVSKVEKATQTEVTKMEMAKICEDYIQKAKEFKDTLQGNHQANMISQNKPRNSEEGMIHLTEPDRVGEPEEAVYNTLIAGDKGDEEEKEDTGILKEGGIAMERARQSFRWYCYPECEGPRKAYSQLLDLCHHWLKPERRSKEQILELLVLEQFLATLPKEIQNWVWQQHPESCGQAVELVENFLTGLSLLERYGKKDFPPAIQILSSKWGETRTMNCARIKFRTLQKVHLQKSQESFQMKRRSWQPGDKRIWKLSCPPGQRLQDFSRFVMPLSRVFLPESRRQDPFGRKSCQALHAQTVAKHSLANRTWLDTSGTTPETSPTKL